MPACIGHGRVLAELQRANIRDDAPPVAWRNLSCVIRHGAEAFAHDLEKISERRLAQTLFVIGRWMPEAALRDHSVSIASARMARRTINIEAFASAIQVGLSNGKWHVVAGIVAHLPRVKIRVLMKLAAGNCPI